MSLLTLSISFSTVWGKVWPILFAIFFFGIIIALHEFGHFTTAKIFKVKVNEFSIGMGPALLKKQKGETKYALRLLPIGGYVALEGEDDDSEDPRAFGNQKAWKRLIILAAGAVLNIILGLLLISVMLASDGSIPTTAVTEISTSMSENADGLREGDIIKSIDGTKVFSARDLYYSLYRNADGCYDIEFTRDGEKMSVQQMKVYYSADEGLCDFIVGTKAVTFLNLLPGSVRETVSMSKLIWLSLLDMFRGNFGLSDISGPVGTINIVADTASDAVNNANYSGIIFILAFITVNIGMVNLLPLPALDGGRIFFTVIEMIVRRPVPKKFEAVVHAVGLALLLGLMALITFNDIVNIVKG